MRWVGYLLGLIVGAVFGFWVHTFWEELTGIGASRPPSFDFYVPLALFLAATGVLIAVKAGTDEETVPFDRAPEKRSPRR